MSAVHPTLQADRAPTAKGADQDTKDVNKYASGGSNSSNTTTSDSSTHLHHSKASTNSLSGEALINRQQSFDNIDLPGHPPLQDPFNSAKPISSCSNNGALVYDGVRNMRLNPVAIPDLRLQWGRKPNSVLIVKKDDPSNVESVRKLVKWLKEERQITCYAEPDVVEKGLPECKQFQVQRDRKLIDFCITIGGDGTVLQLSSLFKGPWNVPPVMSFMGGTLGFLTTFDFKDHRELIDKVLNSTAENPDNYVTVCPRMRLLCTVYRQSKHGSKPEPYRSFQPLNEMLIGRGSSPFLSALDIFLAREHDTHHDDELLGTAMADGLLVSSATGSTAYSMAAGGPFVSPSAPAMLITPVCPHTLSFRPIVLPDVSRLSIRVSCSSRSSAVANFDGRGQIELAPGDYVHVQMSPWPVPAINISNSTTESLWFRAITTKLHWNAGNGPSRPPPLGKSTKMLNDGCNQCGNGNDHDHEASRRGGSDEHEDHGANETDKTHHTTDNRNADDAQKDATSRANGSNSTHGHSPITMSGSLTDRQSSSASGKRSPSAAHNTMSSPVSRRLISHPNDSDDEVKSMSLHGQAVSEHPSSDEEEDDSDDAKDDTQSRSINGTSARHKHTVDPPQRTRQNTAAAIEHEARVGPRQDEEVVSGSSILMRQASDLDG